MNHGNDFDRENAEDRKYRIAVTEKRARERAAKKKLEAAAPALLEALWQVLGDAEKEIPLYLLSENGLKAKAAIEATGGTI